MYRSRDVEAAQALGAEIHGHEAVLGQEPYLDGFKVITTARRVSLRQADHLGRVGSKNGSGLRDLTVPERQVLAWLQPNHPEYFQPSNFPVFNLLVEEGRYYGFPIHGIPGLKIAAISSL